MWYFVAYVVAVVFALVFAVGAHKASNDDE